MCGRFTQTFSWDQADQFLDLSGQREIVTVIDAIDRKIDLHRRKRAVLGNLFKALLRKLMTGRIRVADLDLSVLETVSPQPLASTPINTAICGPEL